MITDPSHPLVRALEGVQADVVYLNPRSGTQVGPEKSEAVAGRPDVRAIAESYYGSSDALHGDSVPEVTILNEKPIHRLMIYLHAQGASISDIAKHVGYSKVMVGQILRQPWARQRLIQLLNETGKDAVKHFLTNEVAPSLEVLREVRDDTSEKGNTRIMAASAILDRALGKPTVNVVTDNTNRNLPASAAAIDAELASVRSQLKAKGLDDGTGTN